MTGSKKEWLLIQKKKETSKTKLLEQLRQLRDILGWHLGWDPLYQDFDYHNIADYFASTVATWSVKFLQQFIFLIQIAAVSLCHFQNQY